MTLFKIGDRVRIVGGFSKVIGETGTIVSLRGDEPNATRGGRHRRSYDEIHFMQRDFLIGVEFDNSERLKDFLPLHNLWGDIESDSGLWYCYSHMNWCYEFIKKIDIDVLFEF